MTYQWTVDTIAPNTIIDSGPSQEGEAPRPEETDPFLFFTFHCRSCVICRTGVHLQFERPSPDFHIFILLKSLV